MSGVTLHCLPHTGQLESGPVPSRLKQTESEGVGQLLQEHLLGQVQSVSVTQSYTHCYNGTLKQSTSERPMGAPVILALSSVRQTGLPHTWVSSHTHTSKALVGSRPFCSRPFCSYVCGHIPRQSLALEVLVRVIHPSQGDQVMPHT